MVKTGDDLGDLNRALDRLATGKQNTPRSQHRLTELEPTADNLKRAESELKEASPDEKEELLKFINNTRRTLGMKDYEEELSVNWNIGELYPDEKLVWMIPEDYLAKVPHPSTTNFSALVGLDKITLEEGGQGYDLGSLQSLRKRIVEGEKVDVLSLDYKNMWYGYPSHEGRHRAVVCYKLGIKEVPVIVRKEETSEENPDGVDEKQEEKLKGVKGVTLKKMFSLEAERETCELSVRDVKDKVYAMYDPKRLSAEELDQAIIELKRDGLIISPRKGKIRRTECREHLLPRDPNKVRVRITEDLPAFMGIDGEIYRLKEGDVLALPKTNAEILLKREVAKTEKAGEEVVGKKEPWAMTKDEIRKWDFPIPEGGASKTPKTVFSWIKEDYETLYDLSKQKDQFRLNEVLGKGWEHEWRSMLHLKPRIIKNQPITIYRATEYDYIIPGSYVSESLEYAKGHLETILRGKGKILSTEVKPSELMIYGDPHEFIYIPESVEAFHKPLIQKALKEGKSVPAEILADYPELKENPIEIDEGEKYQKEMEEAITEDMKREGWLFDEKSGKWVDYSRYVDRLKRLGVEIDKVPAIVEVGNTTTVVGKYDTYRLNFALGEISREDAPKFVPVTLKGKVVNVKKSTEAELLKKKLREEEKRVKQLKLREERRLAFYEENEQNKINNIPEEELSLYDRLQLKFLEEGGLS